MPPVGSSDDERPLVVGEKFILATRETGYRGSVAAISELVDNALQAGASRIQVLLHEAYDSHQASGRPREVSVGVLDNGIGMELDDLWTSVQFGGSSRFDDRSGFGRFGMGLPNSSVSQTRRVEVYSWRRLDRILFTYLDVDEVAAGRLRSIPQPRPKCLPVWAVDAAQRSGTLIVWPRCDRLDYRKASTLATKLTGELGRIYRRLIWSGRELLVNNTRIPSVDPLFCHPETGEGGGHPFGKELKYEIAVTANVSSEVVVRFTELPVLAWASLSNEEKRLRGIVGGAGVSFLRAGREIDYAWRLVGAKRRENYDDWWRCEVSFSPELDDLFGVTHSKQGVMPGQLLRSVLGPDLEGVARTLNTRVRKEFSTFKRSTPSRAVVNASTRDKYLPRQGGSANRGKGSAGLTYKIRCRPLDDSEFFQVESRNAGLTITINENHPFVERLYGPALANDDSAARYAMECLLLAAARAELDIDSPVGSRWLQSYQRAWSDALVAFLDAQS